MTIALREKNRRVWVGQWSYQWKDSLPLGISVEANHLWINIHCKIDTDNYMTIHHKGTSYFDSTAHLMCFVYSFKRNDV